LAADLVRAHGDGLGEIAVAEDLQAVLGELDRARLLQGLDGHLALQLEPPQLAYVDDGLLHPERVGEAPLGDPALEGHLAALEADEVHVAGAGLLHLPAPAGRLAGPARLPPPDPLLLLHAPTGRWSESRQLVHLIPLRSFRCSLGSHLLPTLTICHLKAFASGGDWEGLGI